MDERKGVDRRSFIKTSAGVAAGAAGIAAGAAAITRAEQGGLGGAVTSEMLEPTGSAPKEPIMAYVHDARRGEVTVLAGTSETTYRDPDLAKRLVSAATRRLTGGSDVIAP
ncbi:MAG TPA: twin-arginine translocation signal domain-containing protein [Solirubrobacteraceae bacterium]|nr:twin-arginine translocation signal domain-containing protein [Solirubrobacteraceae bacterium]